MKNNFVFKLFLCCIFSVFLFTSCLEEGTNQTTDYMFVKAIFSGSQVLFEDPAGNKFYPENLTGTSFDPGTLLWVHYTLNWDDQRYQDWYTITVNAHNVPGQVSVHEMPEEEKEGILHDESVHALPLLQYYPHPIDNKYLFFPSYTTDMTEKKYTVEMYYENDATKTDEETGVFNVYFVLKENNETGSSLNNIVGDMSRLIVREGAAQGRERIEVLVKFPEKRGENEKMQYASFGDSFVIWKQSSSEED